MAISVTVVEQRFPATLEVTSSEIVKAVNSSMVTLSIYAMAAWRRLAREVLRFSYNRYMDGLEQDYGVDENGLTTIEFKIKTGKSHERYKKYYVTGLIEFGMDSHDMKRRVPNARSAKTAKDGSKYLIVPFIHTTGERSSLNLQFHVPPAAVARKFRKLQVGGQLEGFGDKYKKTNKAGYRWKVSRYERLAKNFKYKSGGRVRTSQYKGITFRTMKEPGKQSKGAWFHPGIKARLIHKRVFAEIENSLLDKSIGLEIRKALSR